MIVSFLKHHVMFLPGKRRVVCIQTRFGRPLRAPAHGDGSAGDEGPPRKSGCVYPLCSRAARGHLVKRIPFCVPSQCSPAFAHSPYVDDALVVPGKDYRNENCEPSLQLPNTPLVALDNRLELGGTRFHRCGNEFRGRELVRIRLCGVGGVAIVSTGQLSLSDQRQFRAVMASPGRPAGSVSRHNPFRAKSSPGSAASSKQHRAHSSFSGDTPATTRKSAEGCH